jgi:hypothetical protein
MIIKNELVAGILIAMGTFVWICLEYISGLQDTYIDYHMYVTNLSFVIPVIGINWALKKRFHSFAPGTFQIKDGLISGVIVSVTAAFLIIPMLLSFFTYINPDFFDSMISESVKHAILNGENTIRAVQDAQEYFNLNSYLMQTFTGMLIFGLLVSLMVSYRLMKKTRYIEKKMI